MHPASENMPRPRQTSPAAQSLSAEQLVPAGRSELELQDVVTPTARERDRRTLRPIDMLDTYCFARATVKRAASTELFSMVESDTSVAISVIESIRPRSPRKTHDPSETAVMCVWHDAC